MTMQNNKLPVWRFLPLYKLTAPRLSSGGRNNHGRIVTFHRGAHHKNRFRIIDFRRRFLNIPAFVLRIEADFLRGTPVFLIVYANGLLSYILAVKDVKARSTLTSGPKSPILAGCATYLKRIPMGQSVHNIDFRPGLGGAFVRTAGTKAQILRRKLNFVILKLPSGELRAFPQDSYATIGVIQQYAPFSHKLNKAGAKRWLGRRPIVRGVAMNPIDHPHGGGEGKTSGGRPSCSPWGILTKGYKTRSSRKVLTHIIKPRSIVNLQ